MTMPLVTVICLSHNHERYIRDAITSVLDQTYQNLQIIVIDDASSDNTRAIIDELISRHPEIEFFAIETNAGNCHAFNIGLAKAKGEYIIDFATDDIMLADKISQQVSLFHTLDKSYGVIFTDAAFVNEDGHHIRNHYDYLFRKKLLHKIPQGDVYADVLSTYFIASPTMMVRKIVFDQLQGYDENLSYEDFDFWVRSSRIFKYAYLDEITTKIRLSKKSMSRGWYKRGDTQLYSTWLVCKKAMLLNRTEAEKVALVKRLKYEIRQSVFSENHKEAKLFYDLLKETSNPGLTYNLLIVLNKLKLPLSFLRRLYHKLRFGV
jgi:glycosyltransferase involved in cell wall biosynthesis